MSTYEQGVARLIRIASAAALVILGLCISPGLAAVISGRGGVEFAISVMWSMIGPLLAASHRLPGLGRTPPVSAPAPRYSDGRNHLASDPTGPRPTIAPVAPYFRSSNHTE